MSGTIPRSKSGRERLQRALVKLSRGSSPVRRRPEAPERPTVQTRVVQPEAAPQPIDAAEVSGPALPAELADLVERLDRIADRLSDLEVQPHLLPPSREIFQEWVRLRRWDEISFSEFLKLRRAGRV